MPIDYLQKILTAKVYDVAIESALDVAPTLTRRLGNRVLLKREDQQPVFSFKLRGAYNKMAHLSAAERARGVIAASAGNHAQGLAYHAARLGVSSQIVMPLHTPLVKVFATSGHGADVVLHGLNYDEAFAEARQVRHDIVHRGRRLGEGERGDAQRYVDSLRWLFNLIEQDPNRQQVRENRILLRRIGSTALAPRLPVMISAQGIVVTSGSPSD